MSVSYREIRLKDNKRVTLEFDLNLNGKRRMFRPKITYVENPKTAEERQERKEKRQLADKMRARLEVDELYATNMLDKGFQCNKDFFEYCDEFIERKAPHCEMRTYRAMVEKLKIFNKRKKLFCSDIDEEFLISFKDYLNTTLNGSTPFNYFKKLKRIINEATKAKYFRTNPMAEIVNSKGKSKEKETLVFEEVKALLETECRNEVIKTAFLFCCYTGIRFCDVQALTWNNIKNNTLDLVQIKTKERLTMDLHQDAVKLLEISKRQNNDKLVFKLPTSTTCLEVLREWVAKAEINKHITWHCSRHTFATLLYYQNVNIVTISKLLGHKSLKQTEIYIRVAENAKSKAVKSLRSMFK
ncbi:MAG TPA: hypothetical protein DCQ68_16015 [Chryseobacterium indologenes]|nr:hypothetical protein [Chryseobacterium indologenes]